MEKAKKDVGQKFRRIKHNLVNSSKIDDDDLKIVNALEHRNQKVINAVSIYRKHVSNTVKTGLREENVDKRRKKLDEFSLCADLRDISTDLEASHTTCLHRVIQKISQALQVIVDEKVKHDMMIEKRVLDDLVQFQEMEKALCKSRERLSNAFTDVDIAKKALEKADSTSSNIVQLQDTLDASQLKLENQKDNTITDVYSLAAKEQEIAKVFTALLEEQLEYHRVAMRTLEMVLPEIRRDIDNARPRPVFGVDLSEHLRHTQGRVALVLEKCCTMLRTSGFNEKGLFRVNGNNTKIRRMKAAFDAGQIDSDERAYSLDPHSVCSVLKSYLRELPDPLLTHRLHNDWVNASRLEDEAKLQAFERCIGELPACHRHNLTYLINFLSEMLQHQEQTAMNCSNLAIVFGPNLLGGDIDGNNAVGTKIVETLLKNAPRLFGCPVVSSNSHSGSSSGSNGQQHSHNARPRPVFGVDLSEHLRHTQGRVALVLEKCCTMLRTSGFNEKGYTHFQPSYFFVSYLNLKTLFMKNDFILVFFTFRYLPYCAVVFFIAVGEDCSELMVTIRKIRRMKAAFDAGQIDSDERAYSLDPHSVCSVLKSYLRELPDPLLTHRLHNDWVNASR
ncbi:RhoGAP domain protein [Cooperia oncophora]